MTPARTACVWMRPMLRARAKGMVKAQGAEMPSTGVLVRRVKAAAVLRDPGLGSAEPALGIWSHLVVGYAGLQIRGCALGILNTYPGMRSRSQGIAENMGPGKAGAGRGGSSFPPPGYWHVGECWLRPGEGGT